MPHTILVPGDTRIRLANYLASLQSGRMPAGGRLKSALAGLDLATLTAARFLDVLLNTKVPQIFAESAVAGDGSDWNLTELGILGDISIAVPVTVFDNGHHTAPVAHDPPFPGTLIFTPGALLQNGRGHQPADWAEVTRPDGTLFPYGYFALYERRLLPVFQHIMETAKSHGKLAFVTLPGLGCGQFAGPFKGQLGSAFQAVLEKILARHHNSFSQIHGIYYDPFDECSNRRFDYQGLSLLVRPLRQGNEEKPQLCHPSSYEEKSDYFRDCMLFSIVARDHVSWPGNDFFGGSRCTDDGVKAAATNSMAVMTGVEGRYDPARRAYLPPEPYRTWGEVVEAKGLRL